MTNPLAAYFVSTLWLEDIDGTNSIVAAPLIFFSAELRGIVVVPTGFETNFASIPRALWSLIPKRGKHDWAAVLHDAAYEGQLRTAEGQRMHLIKSLADRLFLEALIVRKVGKRTRQLMYDAVKKYGGAHYRGLDA